MCTVLTVGRDNTDHWIYYCLSYPSLAQMMPGIAPGVRNYSREQWNVWACGPCLKSWWFIWRGSNWYEFTCHAIYILLMQCFWVGYHGICHASLVFSVYTRAFRRVCMVYKENTSDKWHVPRYPSRKHCITTLSHSQIFGKLMEILGRARKSPPISENLRNASKPFLTSLNDLWNFWKTLETVQKFFQMFLWYFKVFWKSSEMFRNLQKCSEIFKNFRKTSETVQR